MTAAGWQRAPLVGAIALVLALVGCSEGDGDADRPHDRAVTTTVAPEPTRPDAGTRFDGRDLPRPVSTLVALEGLVVYYAPDGDAHLELVAVDPVSHEVRWRHPAALPALDPEETVDLYVADGAILAVDRRGSGDLDYRIEAHEADGSVRWTVATDTPIESPHACGDRVCVVTRLGLVSIDAQTGEHRAVPFSLRKFAVSDDQALRHDFRHASPSFDDIVAEPRLGGDPIWRRPLAELVGPDAPLDDLALSVTNAYEGTWVASLVVRPDRQALAGPAGPGLLAAFAVSDGAPRWHRTETAVPCTLPVSADLLVICEQSWSRPTEDEDVTVLTTAVAVVDPATGRDRLHVDTERYDAGAGDRIAVAGPDRLVLRTERGIEIADLRVGAVTPGRPGQVAWCRPKGHLPKVVDSEGNARSYSTAMQGRPCTVDASRASEDRLLAPIIDGTLPPVAEVSAVGIGPWVLWTEDGRLQGVATER
jgi:hypothetical protein